MDHRSEHTCQRRHRLSPVATAVARPPPRYKMTLITFAAVSALLLVIVHLFGPLLEPLPHVAQMLLVSATIVVLLNYVVMPALTRALAGWLYPRDRENRSSRADRKTSPRLRRPDS